MSEIDVAKGLIAEGLFLHETAKLEDEGGINALSGAAWNLQTFLENYCENAPQFFCGATARMNEAKAAFAIARDLSVEAATNMQQAIGDRSERDERSIHILRSGGKLIKVYEEILPKTNELAEEIALLPKVGVGVIAEKADMLLGQFEGLSRTTEKLPYHRLILDELIRELDRSF